MFYKQNSLYKNKIEKCDNSIMPRNMLQNNRLQKKLYGF